MSKQSPEGREPDPTPADPDQLDAVFGALSHAARRRVLVSLHARGGTMTAGEIADRFKHSWPTTTRHLGVLVEAGCLSVQEEGRKRLYSLNHDGLRGVVAWLAEWAIEPTGPTEGRKKWADLPYARMRNAMPPSETNNEEEEES